MKKIYLVCPLTLSYYCIFSFNFLCLGLLILSLFLICKNFGYRYLLVVVLFSGYFFLVDKYNQIKIRAASSPGAVDTIRVKIDSLDINGDQLSFIGRNKSQKYQAFYKIKSEAEQKSLKSLSTNVSFDISASLSEPEKRRNENTFDYQNYLKTKGIYQLLEIQEIKKVRLRKGFNPLEKLELMRKKLINHIEGLVPEPMNKYMLSLLLGFYSRDFSEVRDIYTGLGLVHLFALSGMHINFFISNLRRLILRLGLSIEGTNLLLIPLSLIYGALTGFLVSVSRSLLQKNLSNYGIKGLENFALTLMVFMLVRPSFLLTEAGVLSFFLSFAITLLSQTKKFKNELLDNLFKSTLLSVLAAPLSIYFFHSFQPLSLILTPVFSYLFIHFLLPLLACSLPVSFFLPKILSFPNYLFVYLERLVSLLNDRIMKPIIFGKPSIVIIFLVFLLLFYLIDYFSWRKLTFLSPLVVCLLFLTKFSFIPYISVVDVGQGDSIFLRDRFNQNNVLIDVGGRLDLPSKEKWSIRKKDSNAKRTLIPYLNGKGIGKIDKLVITHAHEDHMGDLLELAENFKIKEIWLAKGALKSKNLLEKLEKIGGETRIHPVKPGDDFKIFGSRLTVLGPLKTGDGGNNDSVVLYGKLLSKNFLFMGDAEGEEEKSLMESYKKLPVDILKAGHHGSKTSSSEDFLRHIKTQVALISCGKNNLYKHPNLETLDRFEKNGIDIFRTDLDGQIIMKEKEGHFTIVKMR
ncbi:DNA internalization-related competence protein ComEC/Rec2 [Streptococcaceae bacterium ESL0687]|nr:DNA internalization-related competence protein ComEC/Rec2 [Streptococcaceae bacterium ESL0687]